MADHHEIDTEHTEAYLRLLATHERGLGAYVHGLVVNRADAEDLLQECKVVMWREFGKFEEGTNFMAWARRVALNQILNYRRKTKRKDAREVVDAEFVAAVAAEIDSRPAHYEARAEALRSCVMKLPKPQRQAVVWRYFEGCGVEEIAAKSGRTEGAVYRMLSRVRGVLNECVTRTVAKEVAG